MRPYTTINQFHKRIITIRSQFRKIVFVREPSPQEILIYNKRMTICQRNVRRLYRIGQKRLIPGSIDEQIDLHRMITSELMATPMNTWLFNILLAQLQKVTKEVIRLQNLGRKPTVWERIKAFLNRFKISRLFTNITNYKRKS